MSYLGAPFTSHPHCPREEGKPESDPMAREGNTTERQIRDLTVVLLGGLPRHLQCHQPPPFEGLLGSPSLFLSGPSHPGSLAMPQPPETSPQRGRQLIRDCRALKSQLGLNPQLLNCFPFLTLSSWRKQLCAKSFRDYQQ